MAVERDATRGVKMDDAWRAWARGGHDPAALAADNGWPQENLQTVERWRGGEDRLHFPTLDQVREILRESFVEKTCHVPAYGLGERFPFLVLEPRA